MKRLLLLALAVAFAACSPDITIGPDNSTKYVEAEFDPAHSVIPLPNDLVFLDASGQPDVRLHAPETGGTDAQNEFNRDYLNLLDGFPMESTASMLFDKPIDPASIQLFGPTGGNLAVFDITDTANPLPVSAVNVTTAAAANGGMAMNILPKSGFWTRGHHYAVMVLGGANGIKGASSGQTVTGSPTWALVISSTPLVTCDTNGNNCVLGTSAIPTTEKDPAKQYESQVKLAKQLEGLRLNYAPVINGALAAVPGLNRTDIALVWTFTITSQAEVTFDPANSIIPFPNDILFVDPATGQLDTKLHLPVPPDAGALTDLYTGLNTLDGFSTTAPIVTENGDGTGPLVQGKVDVASVGLGTTAPINIIQAAAGKGALPTTAGGAIKAHACLNCPGIVMTQTDGGPILLPDGGPKPDTLAVVPDVPLTERTQYVLYVTTDLKDTLGKNVIPSPVFALVRSSAPLYDGTKSTVSLLTDAQAQQLEALRAGLKPLFESLKNGGLPRKKVALAWAFTTQSTVTQLSQLHGIPFTPPASTQVPSVPLWIQAIPPPAGVPATNVGAWYIGEIVDVFLLTDPRGVFNPAAPATPFIPFVMSVPAAAAPAGGYPVTMYGHGLTRTRTDGFALASALATAGQVMIAIDEPWHGDRNTCKGFGNYLLSAGVPAQAALDLFACVNPAPGTGNPTQTCNTAGRCQSIDRTGALACAPSGPGMADQDKGCFLAGQGHCASDGKCENGAFASVFTPAPGVNIPVNGWNLLNLTNFFATRDNFRQQVVSHGQLARVIQSSATGNLGQQAGGITLDGTKISYAGQSLGGILGTLYSAVAPEVRNAALNVPGGDPALILLTSPAFAQQKAAFQAGLAAQGVPTNSPTYDTFIGIAKWIIDPADPLNAAPYLARNTRSSAQDPLANAGSTRRGYVQWIADDQVVPNPSTVELIRSVVGDPTATGVLLRPTDTGGIANFWAKQFPSSGVPANNHGFLLGSAGAGTAAAAQGEIAGFVAGAAPF
ncbi:MAG TPA: hypothetical protein VLT82_00305 [Myxococcaceae bacterium]|nr:hypothetical protein [Myxococcaceae bacterium]